MFIEDRVNYCSPRPFATLEHIRGTWREWNLFTRIFGLYPRKGSLVVGGDADITVYDPSGDGTISASTHHQRCDRNIYEGFAVKGRVVKVIAGGRVAFSDGDLKVERGAGRFIKRPVS